MLTLGTVKGMVAEADMKCKGRVPTIKMLRDGNVKVLAHEVVDGQTEIILYENGFVFYRAADHGTVFPIKDCCGYCYESVERGAGNDCCVLKQEFFDEECWYLLPLLIGEDRIKKNEDGRIGIGSNVVSYNAVAEDWSELGHLDDTLKRIITEEVAEMVWKNLTKTQRNVIELRFWEKKPECVIARELGITPQAVSDAVRKAYVRLKKMIGEKELRSYLEEVSGYGM